MKCTKCCRCLVVARVGFPILNMTSPSFRMHCTSSLPQALVQCIHLILHFPCRYLSLFLLKILLTNPASSPVAKLKAGVMTSKSRHGFRITRIKRASSATYKKHAHRFLVDATASPRTISRFRRIELHKTQVIANRSKAQPTLRPETCLC